MKPFAVACELVAALTMMLATPIAAPAQRVGVGIVAITTDHQLLGGALGGGASVGFARRDARLDVRFGVDRVHGSADRVGVPCAGLILPGACAAEPLRDNARLTSVSGGAVFRAVGGRRASLSFTADLALASVRADTRGLTGERALTASKQLWGTMIGADALWTPWARVPIALEIEAGVGGLFPVAHDYVVDGYAPFESGFHVTRVRAGLALRP